MLHKVILTLSGVVREETEASSDLLLVPCSAFEGEVKRRFVLFQRVRSQPLLNHLNSCLGIIAHCQLRPGIRAECLVPGIFC